MTIKELSEKHTLIAKVLQSWAEDSSTVMAFLHFGKISGYIAALEETGEITTAEWSNLLTELDKLFGEALDRVARKGGEAK